MAARIVDSHTGGEPTRILVSGGPDLGTGSMAERRARMQAEHDGWRRALANEPRGNDVIVGAVLCEPERTGSAAGVIFFNNVGYLGMCGHGTIGLIETLRHLGRVGPGAHVIETPVGDVTATLHEDGSVNVRNVPAYRKAKGVRVDVPGLGAVTGDVAWGGNWFFLCSDHGIPVDAGHLRELTQAAAAIRAALPAAGITGDGDAEIDHVELLAPPRDDANHGRNFVLCPGSAYDRSPCGTGTSAKLACLAADGKLRAGDTWRQESVIGSVFAGSWEPAGEPGRIVPTIRGRAHVMLDAQVIVDPRDPFAWGF